MNIRTNPFIVELEEQKKSTLGIEFRSRLNDLSDHPA